MGQTIDGGKGDHTSPKDVDKNELRVGIEVEYEHADGDRIAAIDISLDHLAEDPTYYSKLVKSGIVDEPKAIELAKELLGVEPKDLEERKEIMSKNINEYSNFTTSAKTERAMKQKIKKAFNSSGREVKSIKKKGIGGSNPTWWLYDAKKEKIGLWYPESGKLTYTTNESVKLSNIIREELKGLLKEEPELWKYIHNFGNTYIPKKQGK